MLKAAPLAKSTVRCVSGPSTSSFDIAVVGGGLVGNAFAAACCANEVLDRKIVLLEAAPFPVSATLDKSNEYSNRVSAISPGTKKFFESLGIWKRLEDFRVKPVHNMMVWDASSDSYITFQANENGINPQNDAANKPLAYIVENSAMIQAFSEKITQAHDSGARSIDIIYGAKVDSITYPTTSDQSKPAEISLKDGSKIAASLIIGADGFNSSVRQAFKSNNYVSWNYSQKAIVATLELAQDTPNNNNTAWQRFTETGPIALLPLSPTMSSLVWTSSFPEIDRLMALADDEFVDALNDSLVTDHNQSELVNSILRLWNGGLEMFAEKSGLITNKNRSNGLHRSLSTPPAVVNVVSNSRASFPLGFGHSTQYVAPRVALIGDAAHRIHPLAGQGVNLGFRDVQCLTNIIANCTTTGRDIGSLSQLLKYESERQKYNTPMMVSMDFLNRLYSNTFTPLVLARSLGLAFVNNVPPVKKLFKSQAVV